MENMPRLPHLTVRGRTDSLGFKYPRTVVVDPNAVKSRDRRLHGGNLLRQVGEVRDSYSQVVEEELPEGVVRDDAVYVEFTSEWGHLLKFESLDQDKASANYQILNVREETRESADGSGSTETRYHVAVMLTKGGLDALIKKIQQYIRENYIHRGVDTNNPKNNALVANIDAIQLATLRSFWVDAPEVPFPLEDEALWWEVWFRRSGHDAAKLEQVIANLRAFEVQIGVERLSFAEHEVRLVKGTSRQLSQSLLLLDNLAELRKPQVTAEFVLGRGVSLTEHQEWMEYLLGKLDPVESEGGVTICLLDSGVNNRHPLLDPVLPDHRLFSYKPDDWGVYDGVRNGGHGTAMAGLALYGDLTEAIYSPHRIRLLHDVESYKVIQDSDPTQPQLYGQVTEEGAATVILARPMTTRVYCMAVTGKESMFRGRPSTWSASIDNITFGNLLDPVAPQLFIQSGGNVEITAPGHYPDENHLSSIHDPGQAYNALTVGAYTRKDRLDAATGYRPLAPNGAMAPCNSTSLTWEDQWPLKPEVVMEGGNLSTNDDFTGDHDALRLLSLDRDYPQAIFMPFGDTSGAAALAARLAAQLWAEYPQYWPETIRGLIVHSADWSSEMLGGRQFTRLNSGEKRTLLRTVGYGIPSLEKASHSARSSLTMVIEREIQPYKRSGSEGKYNDCHLFQLPWPTSVLQEELQSANVTLKVTLSYFIEPNPGSRNRKYVKNFSYHSHALQFAVIKPGESLRVFQRRITASVELPDDEIDRTGEPWSIGTLRNKGSIKKDFVTMSGADMATRHVIAVYPQGGWYKTRKKLRKQEARIRYSLLVTLETESVNVDIYAPVLSLIEAEVPV